MKNSKKLIIFYIIIIFQFTVNINCKYYVPIERTHRTATLIGTKLYFLGGLKDQGHNDFFYLDISKSFDKTKGPLPFVDLSNKALEIPAHSGAATSVFGELKDSIFLFGGDMGSSNSPLRLTYSFNATELKWKSATVSQGNIPTRRIFMTATTDNNNDVHGSFDQLGYSNETNIFDTFNKTWTMNVNAFARDGHTATFLPDTGEIIYIGGADINGLVDITNLIVYNTINNEWSKWITKNPPEQRYGHSAVLTNDKRIIIFGGAQTNLELPVKNYYVVLDVTTREWYQGKEDPSIGAPFKHHTATLYNDYMFIAFGHVFSRDRPLSKDILIYKIRDYANFTEVDSFINENDVTNATAPTSDDAKSHNRSAIIEAILGIILGIITIVIVLLIFLKWHKRTHPVIPTP